MKIRKITLDNLKGFQRTAELGDSGRTVLCGENGCGKTALLQAVEIALTGQDARLGKRATAGLVSGWPMRVGVEFLSEDTGQAFGVSRTFTQSATGGVTEKIALEPSRGERTKRAAEDRLRKSGIASAIVDLQTFQALTPGKRAEYLAARLPDGQVDLDAILVEIGVPELERDLRGAWDQQAALAENLGALTRVLSELVSEAAGAEREAKASHARLISRRGDIDSDSATAADLEAERETLRSRVGSLQAQLGADEARGDSLEDLQARLGSVELELAGAREAQVAAEAREAQARSEAPEELPPIEDEAAQKRIAVLTAEAQAKSHKVDELRQALDAIDIRQRGLERERCPVSSLLCPCADDVQADQEGAIAHQKAALDAAHEEARQARQVVAEAVERENLAVGERRAAAKALEAKAQALADAEDEHKRALSLIEQLSQKKTEIAAQLAQAPGTLDRDDVRRQLATTEAMIGVLDRRIAGKEQARAIAQEALDAEERMSELGSTLRARRDAQAKAKVVVARVLGAVLGPFVQNVAGMLSVVDPKYAIEVDASGGGLEFRVSTGGPFRPWGSLSGGEAVVFSAALALALVRLENSPTKILLLEAAEADDANLAGLLSALEQMGSDFDSIIVASAHAETIHDGWEVLQVAALPNSLQTA